MAMYIKDSDQPMQFRIILAMRILEEVAPKLYGGGNISFMDRLALAKTWYNFLKYTSSKLLPDISSNPNEWSEEDIRKIADSLVLYARNLIGNLL